MDTALDILLKIAFYVGLAASLTFVVLYGVRSGWRYTDTGRSIMALMSIIAVTYTLGVLALVWPEFFFGDVGRWIALAIRVAIAAALINMTAILLRAQRRDRREEQNGDRGSRSRPHNSADHR